MSDSPLVDTIREFWGYFKDIWGNFRTILDRQEKEEARLNELEKTTNIITDLILNHDKELQRIEELVKGKG